MLAVTNATFDRTSLELPGQYRYNDECYTPDIRVILLFRVSIA